MELPMRRRAFLASGGFGLAGAAALAAPAIAQSQPEIKWRMATSWPKSLDTLFGAAEFLAKRVAEATDNHFQIRVFAGGEIVPALQVLDAVQNNTVEMGHTASYYYIAKDPTFIPDAHIPFGMNYRQMNAWVTHGGGLELLRKFFADYNIYNIPAGNTGAQMGGWFRKEIKTVDDLRGLKFRIGGLGGAVLGKLGVVTQQIAGAAIYPALEKGTIDAAEWVGPYDDEKLGFYKVAKYYYYPGWWEGTSCYHLMVNLGKWNELPKHYQAAVATAASHANLEMTAKYDARNPGAIRRLVTSGVELRPFNNDVMDACLKASQDTYAELNKTNPGFKKIYDSMAAFRSEAYLWHQIAEYTYDSYMIRSRSKL